MRGKKVPEELKAKIIEESLLEDCVVSDLAKRYNLASETIYGWRSAYRKLNSVDSSGAFVELSVSDSVGASLQSASLKFDNVSVDIEGRIKSSSLVSIISILEESC